MAAVLELNATVSSKGQITLPVALRTKLNLVEGSKIKFFYDGKRTLIEPERPVSAYRGMLRDLGIVDTTIPKEADRL